MATKTVNYELTLPEDNEPADQNVFNENFEAIDSILYDKVDKEEGKGLSTNDYTTNEKTKLDGIAEIKTIGNGLSLDDNGELTATGGGSGGTTNYSDLSNKPQINGNTLSGNKTSAQLGLASTSDIPTTASDVNALPDTTKYGASISLTINPTTFVVTVMLKDQDGTTLGAAQTIDLLLKVWSLTALMIARQRKSC